MTPTTTEQRWRQVRGSVSARWNRLGKADLDSIRGNADRLIELLQTRYGYARWMAEHDIALWRRSLVSQSS